ncbi:uncharacterized protein LOC113851632 [Abrus precatorius]|uniref:Uncharacterized protein LOC113851632 n=1 Tax=Abrus precatorius TaxID=3816 RepID=A0A8B8K2U6_ABRPR|nr:uncharacterized protein LOC113851632 [Abrus precatorius]
MATSKRWVGTKPLTSLSPAPMVEHMVPNSGWIEDTVRHCLLIDLPEFKKEDVKLQVDGSAGRIKVRGERQLNEQKRVQFEETFAVPTDSDVDKITGKFDNQILYVDVPKRISQGNHIEKASNGNADNEMRPRGQHDRDRENGGTENENAQYIGRLCNELTRNWDQEYYSDASNTAMDILRRNRGVVMTAALAFSLGIYMSQMFHI